MSFNCLPNCGKCCGIVPIPKSTYEKHKDKLPIDHVLMLAPKDRRSSEEAVFVVAKGTVQCAFLDPMKRCSIYEDRPWVCREFGVGAFAWTDPRMACPFLRPDGEKRTRQEMRRLDAEVAKITGKFMERLHERARELEA